VKVQPVVGIQPNILRWARESIGLSLDEVAIRLKRPIDEVEAWELGEVAPSYPQLEKLAYQIYKRPLAVFFLPNPPEEIPPKREFRTLPEVDLENLSPDTYIQIRKAHAYQLSLRELFFNNNPSDSRIWRDFSLSFDQPIIEQAKEIRRKLGVELIHQISWKNDDVALKQWRSSVENAGIFIFKAPFKQKELSGFCLVDNEFPVIYINNSTTKTRQIFSLLHELSHILLSINGLSKFDKSYINSLPNGEMKIERFCNAVAAEVLIPNVDFNESSSHLPHNIESVNEYEIALLANRYGVSREAILRRFLDQGRVSKEFYENKSRNWARQQKVGKGGDWYASANSYLSERFAKEVISRHYRHQISIEQAADMLGIKAKNYAGLEQRILQGTKI